MQGGWSAAEMETKKVAEEHNIVKVLDKMQVLLFVDKVSIIVCFFPESYTLSLYSC